MAEIEGFFGILSITVMVSQVKKRHDETPPDRGMSMTM